MSYRYMGEVGLGAAARNADPDLDDNLSSEMADLDMQPNTQVEIFGHDEDRDLVMLSWTDMHGTPRITSVETEVFAEQFVEE